MTKIKPLSNKKVIKALEKVGFQPIRQTGSHLFMKNPDGRTTIIPINSKEIYQFIQKKLKLKSLTQFKKKLKFQETSG